MHLKLWQYFVGVFWFYFCLVVSSFCFIFLAFRKETRQQQQQQQNGGRQRKYNKQTQEEYTTTTTTRNKIDFLFLPHKVFIPLSSLPRRSLISNCSKGNSININFLPCLLAFKPNQPTRLDGRPDPSQLNKTTNIIGHRTNLPQSH